MHTDMCVPCDDGYINIRVGAIIQKNGKILMAGNDRVEYLYSVGGRIQFGETAEEAVIREVEEETGVKMEVERLGFVHENYFIGDSPAKMGKRIYEISLYFYMKVPQNFTPVSMSFTEDQYKEFLKWVSPEDDVPMYPAFFKTELSHSSASVKYILTDER